MPTHERRSRSGRSVDDAPGQAGAGSAAGAADVSVRGVALPEVGGRRSSAATGRAVVADAARVVSAPLAQRIANESDWRHGYASCLKELLVASIRTPDDAIAAARAGVAAVHERLVVATPGGDAPLRTSVDEPSDRRLRSVSVMGTAKRETTLSVPLRGSRLVGADLERQLDAWVQAGVVEPSHASAVRAVQANPEWLDLSDVEFVLLGAGAQMSPLQALLRWGAGVHAVDVRNAGVWERLAETARGGAGRLTVPVAENAGTDAVLQAGLATPPATFFSTDAVAHGGVDLLTDLPAVRRWLGDVPGRLVLGNYVYADGVDFFRLAAAVDVLTDVVLADRPDTAVAMLATPTDVFATPPEAVAAARRAWADRGARRWPQAGARAASGGRLFRPSYRTTVGVPDGRELGVADSLVLQQGPNYALAKGLQRWRAVVAHSEGHVVSANVAPPTRTRSVLKNRLLAAAYAGAHRFGVEVFAPSTSSTLMAALLVHDLRNPPGDLAHPHDLFMLGANHGGLWRIPYEPRSVLGLAVLLGLASSTSAPPP